MFLLSFALYIPAIAAGPIALKSRQTSPQAFASSSDLSLALSSYNAPTLNGGNQGSISKTWQLTVDDTSSGKKQSVTGFGAAITDSTVTVFNALSSSQQSQLLQDLFSSDGVNFSLMRHTIASSDLSANAYTYDDANGQVDTSLNSFNLGASGNAMTAFIARAKAVQPDFTLLGTPWSPPGWMKLDNVLTGTTVNNNLNHDYVDSYAQYFVKYLQTFESGGAHVDAITIQNEPLNSQSGYPTMYVYADEEAGLIQDNVGPALQNAGLNTKIWAYDHNTDQPSYPQTVINGASSFVNTVAWHCYATNNSWSVLTDFHNSNPSVTQYMTECWTSPQTSWNQAADFTVGPLQNWASGAMAWVLGTDTNYGPNTGGGCTTCRGLFTVDTSAGTYTLQVDYYMLGQFSKFIPRGASVLDGTGSYDYGNGQKVEAVATLNPDNTRTIVVENTFDQDIWLSVTMQSGEGTWNGPITANGVTTWLLPPST
ncbi:MAG: Endo-1,6-beta-D-glucanase neg1 [Bathelium mastoideum]|nr:MAG: Endo-1,6-beta-D-glucanase neg1 [Bathelium mastoideum]